MAAPSICLRPDCGAPTYQRGLCKKDHENASQIVHRGMVTWAALEAAGKSLPFTRTGPRNPSKDWLLDGVERDGCGALLRDVVEGDIAAGVSPLRLWELRLRGWSKAGVTKTIRSSIARLKKRGIYPTCECGRPYAAHPAAEPCATFAIPPAAAPFEAPPIAPVPSVGPGRPVALPKASPPEAIDRAVVAGMPREEIIRTLKVSDVAVTEAAVRVRATGHEMWCRCRVKPWDHRGRCA